jgi:hypothetical protein
LAKPFNAGNVMATDSLVSHAVKRSHGGLSAFQKERAAFNIIDVATQNVLIPAVPSILSGLHSKNDEE